MKKKIVCLLLATMTTGILMTGCQRKENTTKQQKNKTESVEKTKEKKKDAKTENKEALEEKVETENTNEETSDTQENTTELSGDWRTLGFTMDGEQINFPISYAELKSMGYSIDAEYENEELEGMHYTTGVNDSDINGGIITLST